MQVVKGIPVKLTELALKTNMVKELRLMLLLKPLCSGSFHDNDLDRLFTASFVKCRKTFDKQMQNMIKCGWLRRSDRTGYWNITSMQKIVRRVKSEVSGKNGISVKKNMGIQEFRAWLFAGYLCSHVKKITYFYTKIEPGRALSFSGAFQSKDGKDRHFGISMDKVRSYLGYTRQYMNKMKIAAQKFGFMKSNALWLTNQPVMRGKWGVEFLTRRTFDEMFFNVEYWCESLREKSVAQKRSFRELGVVPIKLYSKRKGK